MTIGEAWSKRGEACLNVGAGDWMSTPREESQERHPDGIHRRCRPRLVANALTQIVTGMQAYA